MKWTREPKLLYAGQISGYPQWSFPSHKHDDLHELIYIREGKGYFTIGDRSYSAGKGDILIYRRGVIHEERSSPEFPLSTYYCGFADMQVEEGARDGILPQNAEPVIRSNKYSPEIGALMSVLFEESSMQEEGYQTICQNILSSVLALVLRMTVSGPAAKEQASGTLAVRIKDYIDKYYAMNINLQHLAEHFHVDRYYLSHSFRRQYDDSPINYLIRRRMGEAKRLLASTEMKVWEIARLIGYENANYFSMLFTRSMGESPSRFKQSHTKTLHYTCERSADGE